MNLVIRAAAALILVLAAFQVADAGDRRAFYDPKTRVLKSHGFVTANEPGDLMRLVPESYAIVPGTVTLNAAGDGDEAYTPPRREDAETIRESLGSIFTGTAAQKRARWVDILEAYPAAGNFLTILRGSLTPAAKATIFELATRIKARIGQGNQVLTQTEYDSLKALATQHQLGALFP